MTWTAFSGEAVILDSKIRKLHREGRVTDAILAIEQALETAHRNGPSGMSYEDFEAKAAQAITTPPLHPSAPSRTHP